MKRQDWKKVSAKHASDKGLKSKVYKYILKFNNK